MPFPYLFSLDFGNTDLYVRQLRQLLPRGRLWNLENDSQIDRTLCAIADEMTRVETRGLELIEESDPSTATETLEDWEEMLGLPDDQVTEISAVLAERQAAVTSKYVAVGGQNAEYFIRIAAAAGYPGVTISNYNTRLARVGRIRMGDRLCGLAMAYAFEMTIPTAQIETGALTTAQFEAFIQHRVHAHASVVFTYV